MGSSELTELLQQWTADGGRSRPPDAGRSTRSFGSSLDYLRRERATIRCSRGARQRGVYQVVDQRVVAGRTRAFFASPLRAMRASSSTMPARTPPTNAAPANAASLNDALLAMPYRDIDLLALDEALTPPPGIRSAAEPHRGAPVFRRPHIDETAEVMRRLRQRSAVNGRSRGRGSTRAGGARRDAERWLQVKEVFHGAVDRGPDERAAYLTTACGVDATLRAEVQRLLEAHDAAGMFIELSPVGAQAADDASAATVLTGLVIGRYEVGRLLGAGGMGQVYAARDRELGRSVAIKVGLSGQADADARLRREAQHASASIIPTSAHARGRVLRLSTVSSWSCSRAGGCPMWRARQPAIGDVMTYVCADRRCARHAHRNGVTHRDLKSANVIITPDKRAKVLDFGLARVLSKAHVKDLSESRASITGDGLVAGTLSVMAPEMLRGEPVDERSDIWSLGVMLYEMATGRRPFEGATGFEVSAAISTRHHRRCLTAFRNRCSGDPLLPGKDPNGRYQNA